MARPEPRFEKVLVANRGEIALRVLRTCRDLGLGTVAVFSDADADAPHVRFADEAVRLGPAPAAESYLNVAAVLDAARRTGAGAVHPGYGFLAEDAAFARAVEAAGLVFIGPRAETVERMGSKAGARAVMAAAGVPVVPGYDGEDQRDERFVAEAARVGFPLLVKASAGGGGKGMTVVRRAEELPAALAQARRVARGAFGDDRLLLERYVEAPRHVEVQILGDAHGRVVHVLERECSVQRRFQKVVEECPAPGLPAEVRDRLHAAAVTAGRAIGYVGAGTVEFLLAPDGRFYFLEVNTRLQVEHPVTERVTGLDLVRLQVLVAQGRPLPLAQADVVARGHAVEARLYAEDPAAGFLPAVGRVVEWAPPDLAGLRVDAGVEAGSVVGIHYDPLLAKVVAWGETRAEAVDRLAGALRRFGVQGVTTNRAFLVDVLRHEAFRAGRLSTHFVDDHWPGGYRPAPLAAEAEARLAVAAALFDAGARRAGIRHVPALRPGWRNNPFRPQDARFTTADGRELRVDYVAEGSERFRVRVGDGAWRRATVVAREAGAVRLDLDGVRQRLVVVADGERRHVRGPDGALTLEAVPRFPPAEAAAPGGGCLAPMPGKVIQVLVAEGEHVKAGAPLVVLEAMKMEQSLTAPSDGVVRAVRCAAGDLVDAMALLVELESDGPN